MLIVTVMNLKNMTRKKMMFMYRPVTVWLHYLAVMCVYVIYKCLSWGGDQQQDLGNLS
jgi:hypothetical protein